MLSCLVYIYFSKLVAVVTVKFSPNVARTASHGFTNLTYVSTYHFCAWWIFPIENPSNAPRSPFSLIQLNMTFPYFHFAYAFGIVIITTIKVGNNNNNHNCQQRVAKTIFTHIYTPPSNIDARVFPFVLYMVYLFNGVYILYNTVICLVIDPIIIFSPAVDVSVTYELVRTYI